MQASIPVISTSEGAISEIIDDGVTGYIVENEGGHINWLPTDQFNRMFRPTEPENPAE